MHVPDAIEDWILGRIDAWRSDGPRAPLLIVLSGNAGDGKSDLIERLLRRVGDPDDIAVIRDATHADSPDENQIANLADFFAPFSDDPAETEVPAASLIAMNTGMALSFFTAADKDGGLPSFATLASVVKHELGLAGEAPPPPGWEFEVVNLDRRNLLHADEGNALFDGMLDRLDPDNPAGILHSEAGACEGCAVRDWCFVRTNLDMLRSRAVRDGLKRHLWGATLNNQLHLTPRTAWDFLYRVTTGGIDFFEGHGSYCERIAELAPSGPNEKPRAENVRRTHERLLYHLLFESPEPPADRGALLAALEETDPTSRSGRNTHEAESAVFSDPSSDADAMREAALVLGAGSASEDDDADTDPDPLLDNLAELLSDPSLWPETADIRLVGRGVLRRAEMLGTPPTIYEELLDPDLEDYLGLLRAYRQWEDPADPPDEIRELNRDLVNGVRAIFGEKVGGELVLPPGLILPCHAVSVLRKDRSRRCHQADS